MIKKTKVECHFCQKKFLKLTTEIKRYPDRKHFCSKECYFQSKQVKDQVCTQCQKPYGVRTRKTYGTNFCSKECQRLHTINRNDFTNRKIGRCVVKRLDDSQEYKDKYWLLECACKEVFSVRHADIRNGNVYECPNCVFRRSEYYIGGKKFGRLAVQDKWEWFTSPTNGKRYRNWWCVCECGTELWVISDSIRRGHTVSCGCYIQKNNSRYANDTLYPIKHGLSGKNKDEIYLRWTLLIGKCHNPKHQSYHLWGHEGYEVCEEWRNNYKTFHDWMVSKEFDITLTVDIKEGKKVFSPSNCYLEKVTVLIKKMQKKTHLKKYGIKYRGEVHTIEEWAKILKIGYRTLLMRWSKCEDMEQCVNGNWVDGSGCHVKRNDVDNQEIKKLYESGHTIKEIEKKLGCGCVKVRLNEMGIKLRPAQRRSRAFKNEMSKFVI